MSSSETTGDSPVALTQYFTADSSLDHGIKVSASPSSSHSDSGELCVFEASLQFAFATTCCFASPPVGADRTCVQPSRAFTSGLPTVWSPAPSPDMATVPTGQFALAGLSPARSSTRACSHYVNNLRVRCMHGDHSRAVRANSRLLAGAAWQCAA